VAGAIAAVALAVTGPTALAAGDPPTSVSAIYSGQRQITVFFQLPLTGVTTGFNVQMVRGGNRTINVPAGTSQTVFAGLKQGEWYSFRVRAQFGRSNGAWSPTTPDVYVLRDGETAPPVTAPPSALLPPSSLSVSVGDRSATLTWTPVAAPPGTKVKSYRVTALPGPIVLEVFGATSAVLKDLDPAQTYTFTVETTLDDGRRSTGVSSAPVTLVPRTTVLSTTPATIAPTTTFAPTTTAAPTTVAPTTSTLPPLPAVPTVGLIAVSKCTTRVWPLSAQGRPLQYSNGAGRGVYVWFGNGVWNVHAYNPDRAAAQFSVQLATSSVLKAYPTLLESPVDLVKATSSTATMSASSAYDIDAIRVASPCSRTITFAVYENGQPIPVSRIFLGAAGSHPTSAKFSVTR
jgi:Fibronectin type III domain